MTDSNSDREWTFLDNREEEEQRQSDDSTSSSDFVHVNRENTVFYQHKAGKQSQAVDQLNLPSVTESRTGQLVVDAAAGHPSAADGLSVIQPSGSELACPERVEADSTSSVPKLIDGLESSTGDESEHSEPELLDERVMSALTCPGSGDTVHPTDGVQGEMVPASGGLVQTPDGVNISESSDSTAADSHSEAQSFGEAESTADGAPGHDDRAADVQEEAENTSQSSSGIEELSMPEEEDEAERTANGMVDGQEDLHLPLPSVEVLKREDKASKVSDTESDFSDIVRIEQSPVDVSTSHQQHRRYFRAVDLMQVSASSSSSGNSSLSSRFQFIHPLPRRHRYIYPRDEEEDSQSLPGDVDDRCESDISGIVPDDSDPDLSSISYSLDQLEIMEGDVIRSYKHRPNSSLNTLLSILALLSLFTTIGVGIGHYLGTTREVMLRSQQAVRIKEIQNEYLGCLRNVELLEAQVSITDAEKIAAVTAVWKQKYEELIIEKVELTQMMKRLEKNMEADLREAKNQLLSNRDEAELLGDEVKMLDDEYKDDKVQRDVPSADETKPITAHMASLNTSSLADKQTHIAENLSKLEKRQIQLEQKEAELRSKEKQLSEYETDLAQQNMLLTQAMRAAARRERRLHLIEGRLQKWQLLLMEREVQLREEYSKLEHEKREVLKEQGHSYNDLQHQTENELANLEQEQANLDQEQPGLDQEQTNLDQEQANLDQEQAGLDQEQTNLDQEQGDLNQEQTNLDQEQADLNQEQAKMLTVQARMEDEHDRLQKDAENNEEMELFSQFNKLKEQANMLKIENDELRLQLARIRYANYNQQNVRESERLINPELKQFVNSLANENIDLKRAVAKLRYTQPLSLDNKATEQPVEGTETREALKQAKALHSDQLPSRKHSDEEKLHENWFPIMWSYMNLLVPTIDLSGLQKVMSSSKLARPLAAQFHFIQNITANVRFTESVKQKLVELKALLNSFAKADRLNSGVLAIVADLKEMFQQEMDSFKDYIHREEIQAKMTSGDGKANERADLAVTSERVIKYQKFVNKTKDGILHLNENIKHAWKKVKNATGDFLKKNKVLKEFGDSVSQSMKNVQKLMEAKWKKVKKHLFKKRLLPESFAWSGTKEAGAENAAPGADSTKHRRRERRRAHVQPSTHDVRYHDHMNHETLETKQFNKEPDHQNKQSSATDYEKYEEYWQQAEFEPDDFLEEGFFEGNNRKWHKHQSKARKLHGRLQRLTDDIFLAMDDDDVEDMYEDFEDLQEDVDGQDQPKELMTWLTCQVRWWKSRLYRKHSNEDLVKGCGRQLMQWQLRALCKPCDSSHKRCRMRGTGATEGPFCRYYQSVILPSLNQGRPGAGDGLGCGRDRGRSPKVLTFVVDSDNPRVEGHLENEHGRLKYSISVDGDAAPEAAAIGNGTDEAATNDPSAKWLFERAEDRETHHHNGLWLFRRRALRDFQRNKPWYFERADARADRRVSERHYQTNDRSNRSGRK